MALKAIHTGAIAASTSNSGLESYGVGNKTHVILPDGRIIYYVGLTGTIWELSANRQTVTQRATIAAQLNNYASPKLVLLHNGTGIAITYSGNGTYNGTTNTNGNNRSGLKIRVLNTTNWTLGLEREINSSIAAVWDIAAHPARDLLVYVSLNPEGDYSTYACAGIAGLAAGNFTIYYHYNSTGGGYHYNGALAIACTFLNQDEPGTNAKFLIATGQGATGFSGNPGTDSGITLVCRYMNSGGGTGTASDNGQAHNLFTIAQGEGNATNTTPMFSRRVMLYNPAPGEWALLYGHMNDNRVMGFATGTYHNRTAGSGFNYEVKKVNCNLSTINGIAFAAMQGGKYIIAPLVRIMAGNNFVVNYNYIKGEAAVDTDYARLTEDTLYNKLQYISSTQSISPDLAVNGFEFLIASTDSPGTTLKTEALYMAVPTHTIADLSPLDGASVNDSNPTLSGSVDLNQGLTQSKYALQFEVAKDTAFSVSPGLTRTEEADLRTINGTDQGPNAVFSKKLAGALAKDNWYWRARLINKFKQAGTWQSTRSFFVGHRPTLVPQSPINNQTITSPNNQYTFSWQFTDPATSDYQTAYEIQVIKKATQEVVASTGKTTSQNLFHTFTIGDANKEIALQWRVRGWDSEDTVGLFTAYQDFIIAAPPTITLLNPTNNQVVDTGVPTFRYKIDVAPGSGQTPRKIKSHSVGVYQAGRAVWGPFRSDNANANTGSEFTKKIQQGILKEAEQYSVEVTATDTSDLSSSSGYVPFTVDWIPPPTSNDVVVDTSHYNVENEGFIEVTWTNATQDPNFLGWVIYRKDDEIDEFGAVVTEGIYKRIFIDYDRGSAYYFRDYFAPSNHKVSYVITQIIDRNGQDLESDIQSPVSVYPKSDGYWLVEPINNNTAARAFKLSIVTGDSYTDEIEEAESIVVGRGRVISKGESLGYKGQLEVQLRNTGDTTARQKKRRLEDIKRINSLAWMRNPYGDIFKVNVGSISVSRIAGVGMNEFCDASVPYTEVDSRR